jgi:hypothetical protein
LFWTKLIPNHDVQVNLDAGTASYHANARFAEDYHDIVNALSGGPGIPGSVSFDLNWFGATQTQTVRDPTNQFKGVYQLDSATLAWSANRQGFKFQSDPADTSTTIFAMIGSEQSGAFFS